MIIVRQIPLYWGIETEAVDKTFLTRSTLHEVLPPFRQSVSAFRVRISPWHFLHIGIFRYEREARRWDLGVTPDQIGDWGAEAQDQDGDDALVSIRPVQQGDLIDLLESSMMRTGELFRGLSHSEIDQEWILSQLETQAEQSLAAIRALQRKVELQTL